MISNFERATPFVDDARSPASPLRALSPMPVIDAPFLSQDSALVRAETAFAQELFAELEDPGFCAALEDVAEEVSRGAVRLLRDPSRRHDLARVMRLRLQPLSDRVHAHLDRLGAVVGQRELAAVEEQELELERTDEESAGELGSPAFEQLFGALRKKMSTAFKGAVRAVKRGLKQGVRLVGQVALGPLLARLKRIVKPLLDRVLGWALDKLPQQYRGVARQLAQRLGLQRGSAGAASPAPRAAVAVATPALAEPPAADAAEPAADHPADHSADHPVDHPADHPADQPADQPADSATGLPVAQELELELDARLTELLVSSERDPEAGLLSYEVLELSEHHELAEGARVAFAAELARLRDGEDPTPAVEGFLPAILPLVRAGIKIIGRKRVVDFLAKAIGGLIRPLVGPSVAPALGQAIADLGLRALVQAETGESPQRAAVGHAALVATVEETVRALGGLPTTVFDSPPLLEAAVLEAFEVAAAANMPPEALRPSQRESSIGGAWVSRPSAAPHWYKKFTHVFDVVVATSSLAGVRTFGGRRLAQWLADAGSSPGAELRARVHLFEATPRTSWSRIARHEQVLTPYRGRLRQAMHPLTVEAAAILLQQPRLGRGLNPPADHQLVSGQRWYFLELERPFLATLATRPFELLGAGPALQARLRLSEPAAQRLATAVREGKSAGILVHQLRQSLRGFEVPLWVWSALAQWLPEHAKAIVVATDSPADGLSLTIPRVAPRAAADRIGIAAGLAG